MTRSEFMKAFRSDDLDLSTEDRREIFLDVLQAKSDITMELMQMLFTSFDVQAIRVARNPNPNAANDREKFVYNALVYACTHSDLHKAWRVLASEFYENVTPNPIDDIGMQGELLFDQCMNGEGTCLSNDVEERWSKLTPAQRFAVMRIWFNETEPRRFNIKPLVHGVADLLK